MKYLGNLATLEQVYAGNMFMGVFGSGSPKPHEMFSNDRRLIDTICGEAGSMPKSDRTHCTVQTTWKYVDANGKRRCAGIKSALRESAYLSIMAMYRCFQLPTLIQVHVNMYLRASPWSTTPSKKTCLPRHYPPAFGDFIAKYVIQNPEASGLQ